MVRAAFVLAHLVLLCRVHGQGFVYTVKVDTLKVLDTHERDDMTVHFFGVATQSELEKTPFDLLFSRSLLILALEAWPDRESMRDLRKYREPRDVRAMRKELKKAIAFLGTATDTVHLSLPMTWWRTDYAPAPNEIELCCAEAFEHAALDLVGTGAVRASREGVRSPKVFLLQAEDNGPGCITTTVDYAMMDGTRFWNVTMQFAELAP